MAARQNIGLAALAEAARLVKPPIVPRPRLRARPADQRRRPRRQVRSRRAAADLDRSRRSADHRRRARPAERGAPRDRDAGQRAGRGAGREARRTRRCITVMSAGWHPGVIGIVAGRLKERFGRPAIVIAETRRRHRQGLGPLDLRRRPRRCGAGRQGQRAAGRRRRARDGGGADGAARAGSRRSATSSTSASPPTSTKSRGDRALLLDALLAPGGVAAALCEALDAAGPYGAGWPQPARRRRTGAAAQDRHRRRRPCPRHRLPATTARASSGSRSAAPTTALGQALLASPADKRWWLAGTIKRDEWNGGNAAEMHLEDAALA